MRWPATRPATERHSRACWPVTFAEETPPQPDPAAFHRLTYGLFVLTSGGEKDNGCITNTAIQVANSPTRLSVAVQKGNLTRTLIEQSGLFNVSSLTRDVPFDVIRRFGMQSGRDTDKFAGFPHAERSRSGILYLTRHANAMFACKVVEKLDLGSHMLFIGEVTEARVLGDRPSCTYAHYQESIKPRR